MPDDFDIIVVGAGIHGAAIAREAARHGRRALLIEQYTEAALGTSSKSSKLIHGGLRYLESGQFKLVRECLRERRRLLTEQPDLVSLVPFFIPVYRHTHRSQWVIAAGLVLYALFGGKSFKRIPKSEWSSLDRLNTRELCAVFCYRDAQTDDKKLTERVLGEAIALGVEVRFCTALESATLPTPPGDIRVRLSGTTAELGCRSLVNAAGPWVNQVLSNILPAATTLPVELVQGTHILVPGELQQGIYYLESPQDQRAVFVMPWQDSIMIGTTETPYQGDPGEARPLESEIRYLLDIWNHYFPEPLSRADVIDSFAGVRVLPASEQQAFSRPRDTRLLRDSNHPGLISIYGGKLTSHQHTATEVLKMIEGTRPD